MTLRGLTDLERGEANPTVNQLAKILDVLGLEFRVVEGGTNENVSLPGLWKTTPAADADGRLEVDYGRLHETEPAPASHPRPAHRT